MTRLPDDWLSVAELRGIRALLGKPDGLQLAAQQIYKLYAGAGVPRRQATGDPNVDRDFSAAVVRALRRRVPAAPRPTGNERGSGHNVAVHCWHGPGPWLWFAPANQRTTAGLTFRVYWGFTAAGAALHAAGLVAGLAEGGRPFRVKIPSGPDGCERADAVVIYVRARDAAACWQALRELHRTALPHLRDATPRFALRLGRGVACAQGPASGESFGMAISRLVAAGLAAALAASEWTPEGRRTHLREAFAAAGRSWDEPRRALRPRFPSRLRQADPAGAPRLPLPSHNDLLREASRIGVELQARKMAGAGRCTWMARTVPLDPAATPPARAEALDASIFSGTAGIALFFAEASQALGTPAFAATAKEAARQALHHLDLGWGKDRRDPWRFGLYAGGVGAAAAAAWVGRRLRDAELEEQAVRELRRQARGVATATRHDLAWGTGGCVTALAPLEARWPELQAPARAARRRLLELVPATPAGDEESSTGFLHGWAGTVWALSTQLPAGKRQAAAHQSALGAMGSPSKAASDVSWSSGLAGRAMAGEDRFTKVGAMREGLRTRLDVPDWDATLFEGTLGTLLAAQEAGAINAEESLRMAGVLLRRARSLARQDPLANLGWPSAAAWGLQPGLLTGVAGVGHALLHLALPDRVTNPLLPLRLPATPPTTAAPWP